MAGVGFLTMTLIFMAIIEFLYYLTPPMNSAGLGGVALLGQQLGFFALLLMAVYESTRNTFIWQLSYALALVWYLARMASYVQGITPLAELGAGFPYLLLSAEVLLIVPLSLLMLPFFSVYLARRRRTE